MRLIRALLMVLVAIPVCAEEAWVQDAVMPYFLAVSVEDVDRAVEWYATAFGLEKLDDNEADDKRWRIVNMKSDRFFVEIIRDNRDEAVGRARGIRKAGFQVPDVERVADRVEKATGTRPQVVDFERHGVRILQLKDPEGNTIQLTSPLAGSQRP